MTHDTVLEPGDHIKVTGENTVVEVKEVVRLPDVEPYVRGFRVEGKDRQGNVRLGAFRAIAYHRIEHKV